MIEKKNSSKNEPLVSPTLRRGENGRGNEEEE